APRMAPGRVQEEAVLPYRGKPEVRGVSPDAVNARARRHERGGRVRPVWASPAVFGERAPDGGELDAEVGGGEGATWLLGPADIIDIVEGDEIEERLRLGD